MEASAVLNAVILGTLPNFAQEQQAFLVRQQAKLLKPIMALEYDDKEEKAEAEDRPMP